MKDLESRIQPTVELFARGCAIHQVFHYYQGKSYHSLGLDLVFNVMSIPSDFFKELRIHFSHFLIVNEGDKLQIHIRLLNDLPF